MSHSQADNKALIDNEYKDEVVIMPIQSYMELIQPFLGKEPNHPYKFRIGGQYKVKIEKIGK